MIKNSAGNISWFQNAKCRGTETELFFPDPETEGSLSRRKLAEKYCAGCQVIIDCAEYALKNREVSGIWGGTAAWSYRNRKDSALYIKKLKLTVEYDRLKALPTSNVNRTKISKILRARNMIKI
jgi:WhiB family redox-sensing transcriptional regulator